ncbi:MAG: hypothetical protein IT581_03235 [Verrucomicrobiales bacterium]|nr:hypothetical protein [Verrucomicrobiales bacterium]
MKHRSRLPLLASMALLLAPASVVLAAPLFEDNLDTDTSSNWTVKAGYYEGTAADDYSVDWAIDYSQLTTRIYPAAGADPEVVKIPPAPHSNGTTKGVRISVNKKDDEAARMAVNLFPKGKTFSGDYALKFDLFLNHAAYADTGVATTEYALFGINHSGEFVNWFALNGTAQRDDFKTTAVGRDNSDGLFFGMVGDGGAARDFVSLQGGGAGQPPVPKLADATGGLPDRDGNGEVDYRDTDPYFQNVFPANRFESPGMPSKRWVSVEISQVANVVTWKIDGHVLARRTNDTAFKSGTIMIGYSDPFSSIDDPRDETYAIFDNVRVEPIRTVVVDTVDNTSGAADGKTSLFEALTNLQENDRVTFNIPGAGPHVIATPLGGYPLIKKEGVVIDGFSQPGASPNSNLFESGNNAVLKIVLDSSSDAQSGDPALPNRTTTRLPFPGYGDSENAILGIYETDDVTIRGLSFLGRHTPGSDEDPSIYGVALVKEAQNCRVQGNWFGLAPDGSSSKPFAAGIAAFRHRVNVDGSDVDTYSGGLFAGTDSNGIDDGGEGNIFFGLRIGLALELPEAITAGNYFNVRPSGRNFINVEDIYQAQVDAGADADTTVENYENGRLTTGSVIGVRGDNINDANERNVFNFAVYDHLIEFYGNATNAIIAGNHFGVGVDGTTTAPVPTSRVPNLIEGPGSGSFRIGSNNDGVADTLEGNLIYKLPGQSFFIAGAGVPMVARRNTLVGNQFIGFPFADGANSRSYETYYAPWVANVADVVPVLSTYTDGKLSGKAAVSASETVFADIDVYVADAEAATGEIIPGKYLGTFFLDAPDIDLNSAPGEFTFDLKDLPVPGNSKLCVVAVYSNSETASESGGSVTGPVSNAVETGSGGTVGPVVIARDGSGVRITFQGTLQSASAITGPWNDVAGATSPYSSATTGSAQFYRARR